MPKDNEGLEATLERKIERRKANTVKKVSAALENRSLTEHTRSVPIQHLPAFR